MAISEENIYDVACFGADRVGNTSIPQTSRFVVDLTPPVSKLSRIKAEILSSPGQRE